VDELELLRTEYRRLFESIRDSLLMAGYSENEIDEMGPVPMLHRMAGERRAYSETMLNVVNYYQADVIDPGCAANITIPRKGKT